MQSALLALTLTFGALVLSFLRVPSTLQTKYLIGVGVILLLWALLAFNLWDMGTTNLATETVINWIGWGGGVGVALLMLIREFRLQNLCQTFEPFTLLDYCRHATPCSRVYFTI